MRSDYKKNDVQPVKIEKAGKSLQITYHMPAESLFYSPGVDFANDGGVLRIAIRRCGINDKCDAMAKAAMPPAEPWTPKVTVPYAGERSYWSTQTVKRRWPLNSSQGAMQ